jgi:tetratricopeptide (TPR) repeat protein
MKRFAGFVCVLALAAGCTRSPAPATPPAVRPSILLITLDTTRADSIGPEAAGVQTPAFNAIGARGRRFRQAYATVPETLPSHASMMTGLYPGGHGVHENARYLGPNMPVAAEELRRLGYRTSAFVSSFVLSRRFGLARGFEVYDDTLGAANERTSRETTDAALAEIGRPSDKPRFVWVHFYDAHYPYGPPEPYRTRYATHPYLGEIAAMDEQIGRLVEAFERRANGPAAIAIVADHGEGLGDHGEAQHGDLLYQSTMHVPMVLAGPGVAAGVDDTPLSTRRIFAVLLDWAAGRSFRAADDSQEIVLGEAMKPFLEYGWQPQVMAVAGRTKEILAGTIEVTDSRGSGDAPAGAALRPRGPRAVAERRAAPRISTRAAPLGYIGSTALPVVRKDAPRPADMMPLLAKLQKASAFFAAGEYAQSIPLLEEVQAADPYNLDAALRLATAHSSLGHEQKAVELFQRAAVIAPKSQDVRTYLALHYARTKDWERALALLEQVVAESPDRLTAVEALASLRARQGQQAMDAGKTDEAIAAFERARALQPAGFRNDLELGVLYLAARRYPEARAALDRALTVRPSDAMALFKRAQVSVLLEEPDKNARIALARQKADETTRALIDRERLFR